MQRIFLRFKEAIPLYSGPPPKHISHGKERERERLREREKEKERKSHINQGGPL